MKGMSTVESAIFPHFDAFALGVFIFSGYVISPLANFTGQSHLGSLITRHRRRPLTIELLEDLDDSTGTYGASTLTDGEAEAVLHGDGGD